MGRLTVKEPDGSWTLRGVSWEELGQLRPPVYGALCKLLSLENRIDEINQEILNTDCSEESIDYIGAMVMELLTMASGQAELTPKPDSVIGLMRRIYGA